MKLHIEIIIAKVKGPSIKDVHTKSQKVDPFPVSPYPQNFRTGSTLSPPLFCVHANIFPDMLQLYSRLEISLTWLQVQ